jgi:hypothetical protein
MHPFRGLLAHQPANVEDLAQQRRCRLLGIARAQSGRIHHVQRAKAHGFKHAVHILLAVDRDDHNRTRAFAMIRRVASTPSMTGMIRSIKIRSGVSSAHRRTASSPSPATHTT